MSVEIVLVKTGFTEKSLARALQRAAFANTFTGTGKHEVNAIGFKGTPDPLDVLKRTVKARERLEKSFV